MKEVYSIWCEWDISQEDIVFPTKEEALSFAKELWAFQNMEKEVDMTFDEAIENGLLFIETKQLKW